MTNIGAIVGGVIGAAAGAALIIAYFQYKISRRPFVDKAKYHDPDYVYKGPNPVDPERGVPRVVETPSPEYEHELEPQVPYQAHLPATTEEHDQQLHEAARASLEMRGAHAPAEVVPTYGETVQK